ncbi:aldehyde dehydrogenase (NADP(+)) [Trinickia violacea]|uniref:2,5-dioxovalerate dehydrogenase n=1 Tax=Trinickia violacea TaxID=2571746 RepID=A0A4P8IYF2_9BURK|nr:aldehyde dehydrogenase (NADP(+)) [Trinickia violacea]QCP52264.1 aldehyde dehydrogenase (NADP(+)) [Trinickia violacea]
MTLSGDLLIGGAAVRGQGLGFHAWNATTGEPLGPEFASATAGQLARACELAAEAFERYSETTSSERAAFLDEIADRIVAIGDELIERACAETGLPRARIEGERTRTVNQLKMFADLVREGSWHDVRIDHALPERRPLPRPDLRLRRVALGPVAVFGASNFPLAFSVAGGDTASALAAGCPVVVKAHGAHPGTSELVGRAVRDAVDACGLPPAVFSLLFDAGFEVGTALVRHPAIQAVGFTGSRSGGLALRAVANAREMPIPVYAEMSSVNPVFALPAALAVRGEPMAQAYVESLTLGSGQFCTNPGLLFAVKGAAFDRFVEVASEALAAKPAGVMLTQGIASAYAQGIERLCGMPGVRVLARGKTAGSEPGWRAQAALLLVEASELIARPALAHEVFGPSSVIVACDSVEQMIALARLLEGQLTATLQIDAADHAAARPLLTALQRVAGRVLANAFPTGVEVADAMVHGGPFPATSDVRSTSVGTAAIERFLRPVCYQGLPQDLLPPVLRDENPSRAARRIDGRLQLPA